MDGIFGNFDIVIHHLDEIVDRLDEIFWPCCEISGRIGEKFDQ